MTNRIGEAGELTPATKRGGAAWILSALLAGVVGGFLSNRLFTISDAPPAGATRGEIIVPADGLMFKTAEGKPVAKLFMTEQGNVFSLFNAGGNRAVELSSFTTGGDISVYGNSEGGALLSMFAATEGGQLTLMGGSKSAVRMYSGKMGGVLTIDESGGYPVVVLGVKKRQGHIELMENGKTEGRTIWQAP